MPLIPQPDVARPQRLVAMAAEAIWKWGPGQGRERREGSWWGAASTHHQLGSLGERCKFSQWRSGHGPDCKRILGALRVSVEQISEIEIHVDVCMHLSICICNMIKKTCVGFSCYELTLQQCNHVGVVANNKQHSPVHEWLFSNWNSSCRQLSHIGNCHILFICFNCQL